MEMEMVMIMVMMMVYDDGDRDGNGDGNDDGGNGFKWMFSSSSYHNFIILRKQVGFVANVKFFSLVEERNKFQNRNGGRDGPQL